MADAARGSLALPELTEEEAVALYDRHLERAEACLDLLDAGEDPQSVRYKKYAIELFGHLLQVRDALLRLAPGERGSLAAAFGSSEEGCARVAQLLVLLTGGTEAGAEPEGGILRLQRSEGPAQVVLGTGARLDVSEGALRAYQSVAGVLDTLSLKNAIERARTRRRENQHFALGLAHRLRRRASAARQSVSDRAEAAAAAAAAAAAGEQEPCSSSTGALEESGVTNVGSLLSRLDESSLEECDSLIQNILSIYDSDGDGVLTGAELESLVEEVAAYVAAEYEQKYSRYNMKMERSLIAEWVRASLDPDTDGKITRDEIMKIKKVVDDID